MLGTVYSVISTCTKMETQKYYFQQFHTLYNYLLLLKFVYSDSYLDISSKKSFTTLTIGTLHNDTYRCPTFILSFFFLKLSRFKFQNLLTRVNGKSKLNRFSSRRRRRFR